MSRMTLGKRRLRNSAIWMSRPWAIASLAVLVAGCTLGQVGTTCSISVREIGRYPSVGEGVEPTIGTLYDFGGIYYEEWEESGLVPGEFFGFDVLQGQKYDAYCVQAAEECWGALDPPSDVGRGPAGDAVAEVRVLARFVSRSGNAAELASNQCLRGTLRIERVSFVKWRAP
jgi:hypothetical protein